MVVAVVVIIVVVVVAVVVVIVVVVVAAAPLIIRSIVPLLLQLCWCHHLRRCLMCLHQCLCMYLWLMWLICLYLRYEYSHLSTGSRAVERVDSAGRGRGGGMERLTNQAY